MNNTHELFEKICAMLKGIGFEPHVLAGDRAVRVGLRDDCGMFDIGFEVQEQLSLLHAAVCVPMVVQEKSRTQVAELIVRANYGWPLGRLDLDMSKGVLAWSASIPIEDADITDRQLQHTLSAGMTMMHRYTVVPGRQGQYITMSLIGKPKEHLVPLAIQNSHVPARRTELSLWPKEKRPEGRGKREKGVRKAAIRCGVARSPIRS